MKMFLNLILYLEITANMYFKTKVCSESRGQNSNRQPHQQANQPTATAAVKSRKKKHHRPPQHHS